MKIDTSQIPKEAAAAAIKARGQELSIEEVLAAALSAWPGARKGNWPEFIFLPLSEEEGE